MKALESKKELGPIMPEEIKAIKAKHAGLLRTAREVFWDALAIGDWFLDSRKRVDKGKHGAGWERWFKDNFEGQISLTTVKHYIRLAANRAFLVAKLENRQEVPELDQIPTFREALSWISDREEAEGKSRKRNKVIDVEASQGSVNGSHSSVEQDPWRAIKIPPPAEVAVELEEQGVEVEDPDREPLAILRGCLKSYVLQRRELERLKDQLQHLEFEIGERIRVAELTPKQVVQCVEWACRGYEEVKVTMLETFGQ